MSPLDRLTHLLSKLPGLGPRSARRVLLFLLKRKEALMLPLAEALQEAANNVQSCSICGNWDTKDPCTLCIDPKRDDKTICVVENVADLWALERSGAFRGRYHVLGGTLSALDGVRPADLRIDELCARASENETEEIILALSATVEGQTTGHYVAEQLMDKNIKITQLSHGLPVGGELDYLDEGTITTALKARR